MDAVMCETCGRVMADGYVQLKVIDVREVKRSRRQKTMYKRTVCPVCAIELTDEIERKAKHEHQ